MNGVYLDNNKTYITLAGSNGVGELFEQNTSWKEAYIDFLENKTFLNKGQDYAKDDGFGNKVTDYSGKLFDMDYDGIPELIIDNGYSPRTMRAAYIYSYINGSVKFLDVGPSDAYYDGADVKSPLIGRYGDAAANWWKYTKTGDKITTTSLGESRDDFLLKPSYEHIFDTSRTDLIKLIKEDYWEIYKRGFYEKIFYNNSDAYNEKAKAEYNNTFQEKVYQEKNQFSLDLLSIPSTKMAEYSITSHYSPNYNLAMTCANLCVNAAAPKEVFLLKAYGNLNVNSKDVFLYSYPNNMHNRDNAKRNGNDFAKDSDLAFSIASTEGYINGELTDVIFITLRGTVGFEALYSGVTSAKNDFYEYVAWDVIWEFEEDVFAGLDDYHKEHPNLGNRPLKFVVTGHSLGGGGANLVSAKLIKESYQKNDWWSKNTNADDIYAYTFGALDSISMKNTNGRKHSNIKTPIIDGYKNIINIYNYLDTYGPDGEGVFYIFSKKITANGSSMYDKFGEFFTFTSNMKDSIRADATCPPHQLVGYIYELKSGHIKRGLKSGDTRLINRCPTDIYVYDDKNLICSIVSDKVEKESLDIPVAVENGQKVLIIPNNKNYKVIIEASDDGSMDYYMQNLDSNDADIISYIEVPLEKGKRMMSDLSSKSSEFSLYVVDNKDNKVELIKPSIEDEQTIEPEIVSKPNNLKKVVVIIAVVISIVMLIVLICSVIIIFVFSRKKRK